jgi:hypothetical protein
MKVIYRFYDGKNAKYNFPFLDKFKTLENFLYVFKGYDITLIADNLQHADSLSRLEAMLPKEKIIQTRLGSSGSCLFAVKYAIENFDESETVYLVEDDYIHNFDAPVIIKQGLGLADISTGYDHLDKYMNPSPNMFVKGGGEETKVFLTQSRHWKYTNSTPMTFATSVKVLKEDLNLYEKYCTNTFVDDWKLCMELKSKGRKIVSPIPGCCTHGEIPYATPFINWEEVYSKMR